MEAVVQAVLDTVRSIPAPALYALVFGFGFASSAFALDVVLPGETGLLLGGWVASISAPTFIGVFVAGAVGAMAGDSFSYWVGRRFGEPLALRWRPVRERLASKIDRARGFYERHGGAAVFAGRWVGALRSVVAFVAGVAEMRFGRFLAWNVAASLAWAAAVVSIGYFLGRFIVDAFRQATLVITVGVVALVAVWWGIRWLRRHPERIPDQVAGRVPHPGIAVGIGVAALAGIVALMVV